jgi:hypothetical protein
MSAEQRTAGDECFKSLFRVPTIAVHLYPEIPFYKMHKVWHLKYDEINARNISKQTTLGIEPANIESHRDFDHPKYKPQM